MGLANDSGSGAILPKPRALGAAITRWWFRLDAAEWLRSQLDAERRARSGFLIFPVSLMIGIVLVYGFGWRPSIWPCFVAAVPFFWLVLRSANPLALAAAGLLLGSGMASAEIARNDTVILSGEATTRLTGRVLWRDRDERARLRYLVAVERTERPTLSRPPGRVEILVGARHAPLAIGETFEGLVRLRPPSGPAQPGGYDFAFGAFQKGLGAYGFALGAPHRVAGEGAARLSPAERLVALRMAISDRIRDTIDGGEGAVASAIITGERTGIPDDVDRWLRVAGLSHVLSISGLHMALVAGFAMAAVRVLLSMIPGIALRMPVKKIAAVVALSISAFYLALSGADVAASRSFIMIAVMLVAVLFDRSALTLRNVAIAAVIVLCWIPHSVLGPSFQMSFGATIALVAAYGLFAARRRGEANEKRGLFRVGFALLLGIAASSLIAGLATAPFSAYHFQRAAPFGLVANMLALPIFSLWIMPLALIATLTMPFGADAPFLWLLGKGLGIVFALARWLAERFPDVPTGRLTDGGLVILAVALLTACLFASRLRLAAVPIAILGLVIAPNRTPPPALLVFEDGRELALNDGRNEFRTLKERPNAFVLNQWQRASGIPIAPNGKDGPLVCESIPDEAAVAAGSRLPNTNSSMADGEKPVRRYCRAATRTGLKLVWTDDFRLAERACNEANLVIVARATRSQHCASGAVLVTLRTLRRSGSLAVYTGNDGEALVVTESIPYPVEEWNRHREARWPERWRRETPTGRDDRRAIAPTGTAAQ